MLIMRLCVLGAAFTAQQYVLLYSANSEQGDLTLPPLPLLLLSLPQTAVDVVLGDSAVLSRQHCRITYNFQAKKWQLVVEVGAQLAGAGDGAACWAAGVF
jgi:hypothetical protein